MLSDVWTRKLQNAISDSARPLHATGPPGQGRRAHASPATRQATSTTAPRPAHTTHPAPACRAHAFATFETVLSHMSSPSQCPIGVHMPVDVWMDPVTCQQNSVPLDPRQWHTVLLASDSRPSPASTITATDTVCFDYFLTTYSPPPSGAHRPRIVPAARIEPAWSQQKK